MQIFRKGHVKAELEWTTNSANQMDYALKTFMMSCEKAEYFQEAVCLLWRVVVFVWFFLAGGGGKHC